MRFTEFQSTNQYRIELTVRALQFCSDICVNYFANFPHVLPELLEVRIRSSRRTHQIDEKQKTKKLTGVESRLQCLSALGFSD